MNFSRGFRWVIEGETFPSLHTWVKLVLKKKKINKERKEEERGGFQYPKGGVAPTRALLRACSQ